MPPPPFLRASVELLAPLLHAHLSTLVGSPHAVKLRQDGLRTASVLLSNILHARLQPLLPRGRGRRGTLLCKPPIPHQTPDNEGEDEGDEGEEEIPKPLV